MNPLLSLLPDTIGGVQSLTPGGAVFFETGEGATSLFAGVLAGILGVRVTGNGQSSVADGSVTAESGDALPLVFPSAHAGVLATPDVSADAAISEFATIADMDIVANISETVPANGLSTGIVDTVPVTLVMPDGQGQEVEFPAMLVVPRSEPDTGDDDLILLLVNPVPPIAVSGNGQEVPPEVEAGGDAFPAPFIAADAAPVEPVFSREVMPETMAAATSGADAVIDVAVEDRTGWMTIPTDWSAEPGSGVARAGAVDAAGSAARDSRPATTRDVPARAVQSITRGMTWGVTPEVSALTTPVTVEAATATAAPAEAAPELAPDVAFDAVANNDIPAPMPRGLVRETVISASEGNRPVLVLTAAGTIDVLRTDGSAPADPRLLRLMERSGATVSIMIGTESATHAVVSPSPDQAAPLVLAQPVVRENVVGENIAIRQPQVSAGGATDTVNTMPALAPVPAPAAKMLPVTGETPAVTLQVPSVTGAQSASEADQPVPPGGPSARPVHESQRDDVSSRADVPATSGKTESTGAIRQVRLTVMTITPMEDAPAPGTQGSPGEPEASVEPALAAEQLLTVEARITTGDVPSLKAQPDQIEPTGGDAAFRKEPVGQFHARVQPAAERHTSPGYGFTDVERTPDTIVSTAGTGAFTATGAPADRTVSSPPAQSVPRLDSGGGGDVRAGRLPSERRESSATGTDTRATSGMHPMQRVTGEPATEIPATVMTDPMAGQEPVGGGERSRNETAVAESTSSVTQTAGMAPDGEYPDAAGSADPSDAGKPRERWGVLTNVMPHVRGYHRLVIGKHAEREAESAPDARPTVPADTSVGVESAVTASPGEETIAPDKSLGATADHAEVPDAGGAARPAEFSTAVQNAGVTVQKPGAAARPPERGNSDESLQHRVIDGETAGKIVSAVVREAKILSHGGRSSAEIRLDPPNLGKIRLDIVTENARVTGRIVVEHAEVRDMFRQNLGELRQHLADSGLRVDAFDVQVGHNGCTDGWARRRMFEDVSAAAGSRRSSRTGSVATVTHGLPNAGSRRMPVRAGGFDIWV